MLGSNLSLLAVSEFIESGGYVLYAIFAVALIVWFLIGERYWYFLFVEKDVIKYLVEKWQPLQVADRYRQKAIRRYWISSFRQAAQQHLGLIKTLTNISMLLGLLGTITGMIALFEGQALSQGSNAKALADGVSRTIIPAMSGLVVAITGFYFSARLEHRAHKEINKLTNQLNISEQ